MWNCQRKSCWTSEVNLSFMWSATLFMERCLLHPKERFNWPSCMSERQKLRSVHSRWNKRVNLSFYYRYQWWWWCAHLQSVKSTPWTKSWASYFKNISGRHKNLIVAMDDPWRCVDATTRRLQRSSVRVVNVIRCVFYKLPSENSSLPRLPHTERRLELSSRGESKKENTWRIQTAWLGWPTWVACDALRRECSVQWVCNGLAVVECK